MVGGRGRARLAAAAALAFASAAWAAAEPPAPKLAPIENIFHELEDTQNPDQEQNDRMLAELAKRLPKEDRKAQLRYARAYCWRHDFSEKPLEERDYADASMAEARRLGDLAAVADLTLCRGNAEQSAGMPDEAFADYDAAVGIAKASGDRRILADALTSRGSLDSERGNLAQGIEDLLEGQRSYELLGMDFWAASNLGSIGDAYRRSGDAQKALEYYRQVVGRYDKSGDVAMSGSTWDGIGFAYSAMGQNKEALEAFETALSKHGEMSGKQPRAKARMLAQDRADIAQVAVDMGDYAKALEMGRQARPDLDPAEDASALALLDVAEGAARSARGEAQQAQASFAAAAALVGKLGNPRYEAILDEAKAKALARAGDWKGAYEASEEFERVHGKLDAMAKEQSSARLRVQFDTERKEAQNRQLLAERELRDKEVEALLSARRWQVAALAAAGALLALLSALAIRRWRQAKKFKILALTDELTGLANRRSILAAGQGAVDAAAQGGAPLSVMVFDIDYFKKINDHHGHDSGDQALALVAKAGAGSLRQFDTLGRTGGEEFMAILPKTTLEQAAMAAERLRAAVSSKELASVAPGLFVTVSVGVAQLGEKERSLLEVSRRADNALYRAKANGRDRVELDYGSQGHPGGSEAI